MVVLSCFPSPPMFFQMVPSLYLPICINLFLDLPRFICNLYLSVSISSKHELCTSTNYTSSICLILSHLVLSILSRPTVADLVVFLHSIYLYTVSPFTLEERSEKHPIQSCTIISIVEHYPTLFLPLPSNLALCCLILFHVISLI